MENVKCSLKRLRDAFMLSAVADSNFVTNAENIGNLAINARISFFFRALIYLHGGQFL